MPEPVVASIRLVFAILALLFFLFAGLGIPEPARIKFLGWGLFFLTLAFFITIQLH